MPQTKVEFGQYNHVAPEIEARPKKKAWNRDWS